MVSQSGIHTLYHLDQKVYDVFLDRIQLIQPRTEGRASLNYCVDKINEGSGLPIWHIVLLNKLKSLNTLCYN